MKLCWDHCGLFTKKFTLKVVSWQHLSLNLMDISEMMVDCWRVGHWSVWIFLRIENPLSESALEAVMDKRPAINFAKLRNRGWPSKVLILLTSHQNAPDLNFSSVADVYIKTEGWSAGESLKSMNSSWVMWNHLNLDEEIAVQDAQLWRRSVYKIYLGWSHPNL